MNNTIIKLQTYPNYKPSGVEWLGDIPEHWELRRLKFLLNGKLKYGANESGIEYAFNLPRYVRITDFGQDGKLSENNKLSLSWKNGNDYLLKDGDILFARSGATVGKNYQFKKSISVEENYCYAGYLIKAEANENLILNNYLYLYTNSDSFNKWKESVIIKATIENIGADKYNQLPVILPPLQEQTTIAEFLEDKTSKIDQAIAIKQQQIDLLKERRQILIHKAVTQGINPAVKLKDSGVEWIGEIPEHWEVRRFKFLCDITTGSKNTEDKVENGKYPFYVRSQKPEKINSYTFDGEAILTAGDGAGVGKVFHYLNEKFDFHQRVYKFSHFKNIKGKLLYYYLKNNFHNVALNGEAKSTVDSLRLPLIQNFLVTIPPMKEQIEIINKIEIANKKIATAISLKEQEIEKLKEYKSSLIDGVVTGKVKVI
ncbi:MAG: restriction endonuclease subunit S [Flavobacterium sp.]